MCRLHSIDSKGVEVLVAGRTSCCEHLSISVVEKSFKMSSTSRENKETIDQVNKLFVHIIYSGVRLKF